MVKENSKQGENQIHLLLGWCKIFRIETFQMFLSLHDESIFLSLKTKLNSFKFWVVLKMGNLHAKDVSRIEERLDD